jgi:tRNA modification GTPase
MVHGKADAAGRGVAPAGSLPVSSATGHGIAELLDRVSELARDLLPGDGAIALNRRQASLLEEARAALSRNVRSTDVVLVAENLRLARAAFDRLTGRAGVEDVLDALFSRFCLGK